MIKIFPSNATNFWTGAESLILDPIEVYETKKKSLNGWYLEVKLNIKYAELIVKDKLIVVQTKSKLNPQAFRIGDVTKDTNYIKFEASHVIFDASSYFLVDVRPEDKTAENALVWINERTDKNSPFIFNSYVLTVNTAYFINKNLLEAMITIEEQWGGYFEADNFNISLLNSIGNDNGVRIAYGNNLEDVEIIEDWSTVCTRIYPTGKDGLMLDPKYIDADIQYNQPYTRSISFSTELGTEATEEELILELQTKAENYLMDAKYPKIKYSVSSNVNQDLEIGDTVRILHPLVTLESEVQEYEYNINTKRVESIVFGNYEKSVTKAFNDIRDSIINNTEKISSQEYLITSLNKLGYVYIDDNEILILDALPKENAKNIWRMGLGGIGFSANGYDGPYRTAITQDGAIVADFITAGSMSTGRIEGLQSILEGITAGLSLNGSNIQASITRLDSIDSNGVKKLINTLFQLDENAFNLSKDGEDMSIKMGYLDVEKVGFEVKRDTVSELSVTNQGVDARSVTVREKLDVGSNIRVMDYQGVRTGFFYNGGS